MGRGGAFSSFSFFINGYLGIVGEEDEIRFDRSFFECGDGGGIPEDGLGMGYSAYRQDEARGYYCSRPERDGETRVRGGK